MVNEEDDIIKKLLKISAILNQHRILVALIFMVVYIATITPFLFLLINHANTIGVDPCAVCYSRIENASGFIGNFSNLTIK